MEEDGQKIGSDSASKSLSSDRAGSAGPVSIASPKLPPRRPKMQVSQGEDKEATPVSQKRKVGTLADAKWNDYSVSAKGRVKRKVSSNIQLATLTRVERMRAVVPLSKGPRIVLVALVAMLICMFKEGEQMKLPDQNSILASRQQMLVVCSNMVVGGFKTLTMDNMASCLSKGRLYCVLSIKISIDSLGRNGYIAYVLHTRPMLLVFAASLGSILAVFVSSFVVPQILKGSIDNIQAQQKDGDLFQKVIKMLPPKLLSLYRGIDVLKLVMNTIFLDAGFYIVVLVVYQLLPLAYGSI